MACGDLLGLHEVVDVVLSADGLGLEGLDLAGLFGVRDVMVRAGDIGFMVVARDIREVRLVVVGVGVVGGGAGGEDGAAVEDVISLLDAVGDGAGEGPGEGRATQFAGDVVNGNFSYFT